MSSIRITSITVRNLGPIADAVIQIDNKPLVIFYGEVRQGKTTILNAVRWALGGAFPDDIIRHGADEAMARIDFTEGGVAGWCARSWYKSAKDGSLKAREIEFVRDGAKVKGRVADAVKGLLNPFQMKQGFFSDMGETERRKYMAEMFGVEDPTADAELLALDSKAKELRAVLSGFGEIDMTEPAPIPDVAKIKAERDAMASQHAAECRRVQDANDAARKHNEMVDGNFRTLAGWKNEVSSLEATLQELRNKIETGEAWMSDPANAEACMYAQPEPPDTSALESQLSDAAALRVRHEQHAANKARAAQRDAKRAELAAAESRQKELRSAKVARLAEVGSKSGVAGLVFAENGGFTFEGTDAGMLSTSQVMRLSELLSARYPEGFNLSLLDRGESMGKSIFALIERATAEEKTILATVVGEKPAKTPDGVGVFIVEGGQVKQ
jgi:DNA repair exonuclease SbcCD ATPase subunit